MKVAVNQGRCVSSGNCALMLPAVFDQRPDDGLVELLNDDPPDTLADQLAEAADMCPAQAIIVGS